MKITEINSIKASELDEKFDKDNLSDKIYCISLMHMLFSVLAGELEKTGTDLAFFLPKQSITARSF